MATKDDITSTEKLLELIRSKGAGSAGKNGEQPARKKLFKRNDKKTAGRRSKKVVKVGVDIHANEIILAVVTPLSDNRQKLLELRRIGLEPGMKKGGVEFINLLRKSLKELNRKYKRPFLWATIPSTDVETRFLQVPKVPVRQLPNAIRWAYQKETAIEESKIFDFQVIDTAYADGEQKTNVVAYTAPKSQINATTELFSKAGWPLKGISIVPFAIQNLLKAGWIEGSGKNVCILFISRDWSRIAIFSNNVLILSRDIKAGVRSMVQAIIETLDRRHNPTQDPLTLALPEQALPLETVENGPNLQRAEKLFAEFLATGPPAEDDLPLRGRDKQVFEIVRPALDRVVRQVEMTLEHFGLNYDKDPIDNVYISGELNANKRIAAYIGKQLGLPVEPLDPFGSVPESRATEAIAESALNRDIFVPAAGMALSENETTPNFIFTYVHKSKKAFTKRFNQVANIVFIGLLCVAMGVFYYYTEKVSALKAKTNLLEMDLEAYSPKLDRNLMASVTGQTISKMKAYSAGASYHLPAAVIAELITVTPDNVKLTRVQVILGSVNSQEITRSGKVLNIEGQISGSSRFFERAVTAYLVRLKKSSIFKQPTIKEKRILETEEGNILRFVISMPII